MEGATRQEQPKHRYSPESRRRAVNKVVVVEDLTVFLVFVLFPTSTDGLSGTEGPDLREVPRERVRQRGCIRQLPRLKDVPPQQLSLGS